MNALFFKRMADYCGIEGRSLRFVKGFNSTMDGKSAIVDGLTSRALYYGRVL